MKSHTMIRWTSTLYVALKRYYRNSNGAPNDSYIKSIEKLGIKLNLENNYEENNVNDAITKLNSLHF